MPLTVTTEHRPAVACVILRPEGSIDASTFTLLAEEVDAALLKSPRLIVFDLVRVNYVSSAGIGVILSAEKALRKAGGKALVANPKPSIKKVFDIVQALPSEQVLVSGAELDAYLAELPQQVAMGTEPSLKAGEFRIANRMAELDGLAAGLRTYCLAAGMTQDDAAEVRLVIEEAVTNTIRHGYRDGNPHEIILRAAVDGGRLTLEIEDDAAAFDPLARTLPDLTLPVEEKPIGGLGILLVRTLMDSVEYQRVGNRNLLRTARWIDRA
jgi:anti-anti-sigma factor